jgi:hypothetical protein
MKYYLKKHMFFTLILASSLVQGFSVVPEFFRTRAEQFIMRERVAGLDPELQKNGWILDQLEKDICELQQSSEKKLLQVNPEACWDLLLIPHASQSCMKELKNQLESVNAAKTIVDWHNKLDHLQTYVHQIKLPESPMLYPLLEKTKKTPLKQLVCLKYIVPLVTAVGVLGYYAMNYCNIPLPFISQKKQGVPEGSVSSVSSPVATDIVSHPSVAHTVVNSSSQNSSSPVDLQPAPQEQIDTPVVLPAVTIPFRVGLQHEHLLKKVKWISSVAPDVLDVFINDIQVIKDSIPTGAPVNVVIPEDQQSIQITIRYVFEWDIPKRVSSIPFAKWAVAWIKKINPLLPLGHSKGNKQVVYEVTRNDKAIDLVFAGWDSREHRQVTPQCPGRSDVMSRNDLFQVPLVRKIGEKVIFAQPETLFDT